MAETVTLDLARGDKIVDRDAGFDVFRLPDMPCQGGSKVVGAVGCRLLATGLGRRKNLRLVIITSWRTDVPRVSAGAVVSGYGGCTFVAVF